MPEILASLADVNTYLPTDKIIATEGNTGLIQVDMARFVRSTLAGTFPVSTLTQWASPETTPEIIRTVAGRLIAAYYYMERYAEDEIDSPEYAQRLYNEAISTINGIKDGTYKVIEVDPDTGEGTILDPSGTTGFDNTDFYPNDTADEPKFTMTMTFG